jgi:TIR domain
VQTLTPTLFPVYAPADRKLAERLAKFLEQGADVRVFLEEGELRAGEDLLSKAREARMADLAVVLFSRESMSLSPRWARAQWEGPLVTEPADDGVRIAFLRCDDCVPPKVLAPQFTARQLRQLKRWVRGCDPGTPPDSGDLNILGMALADRPGFETIESAELASQFAHGFRDDFDAVVFLDCADRSLAALAGDLAVRLGLRLEGPLEQNLARLREFCAPRRLLLVLEDPRTPDALELVPEGRCSTLVSQAPAPAAAPDPIREIQAAFHDPATPWPDLCARARQGRRLLRDAGRIAELYELMQQWHTGAGAADDRAVLDESTRELVWILEGWGLAEEAHLLDYRRASEFDDQMMLSFDINAHS